MSNGYTGRFNEQSGFWAALRRAALGILRQELAKPYVPTPLSRFGSGPAACQAWARRREIDRASWACGREADAHDIARIDKGGLAGNATALVTMLVHRPFEVLRLIR